MLLTLFCQIFVVLVVLVRVFVVALDSFVQLLPVFAGPIAPPLRPTPPWPSWPVPS